mmetsp:Transcript_6310/g.23098  ORF Transcript_6310/g.23098 Transcript_6310/m.23098 type:complete len:203 (+) Transcript_6310:4615-5223(+)
MIALFERLVQGYLADLASHRRLRELRQRVYRILHAVRRLERVHDFHVQHAVDRNRDVVLGHCGLIRHRDGFFFQVPHVRDLVHERHEKVDPRAERRVELPEPLDDDDGLLRDDANAVVHRSAHHREAAQGRVVLATTLTMDVDAGDGRARGDAVVRGRRERQRERRVRRGRREDARAGGASEQRAGRRCRSHAAMRGDGSVC